MAHDSTKDVESLYNRFPYPSPVAGDQLIQDVANLIAFLRPSDSLAGKSVLDAGCGTGHRLVGLAKKFPKARFTGMDMAAASLEVAEALARRHHVDNVRFQRVDLLAAPMEETYDLIVSTGVIHHLADPQRGLRNLCAGLAPNGSIALWLYHPFGEFERLLDRELALTLAGQGSAWLEEGVDLLKSLGISLSRDRYSGAFAKRDNEALDDASIDVDAYLHPIVNAYRFEQALELLEKCAMDWGAVNSVSSGANTKLIDLGQVSSAGVALFCLRNKELFEAKDLRDRYEKLATREKLEVIELRTKPKGYTVVAGKRAALASFDDRIRSNAVSFAK